MMVLRGWWQTPSPASKVVGSLFHSLLLHDHVSMSHFQVGRVQEPTCYIITVICLNPLQVAAVFSKVPRGKDDGQAK
jgi:hypothetical protein